VKILVAGKHGQVAQALVRAASSQALDVVALSRAEMDITDRQSVETAIADHQPAVVINAGAYTAVDRAESEIEQAFAVNKTGPLNLAKACDGAGIPLLHISTDFVFDGCKESAYLETDVCNPINVYGQSKLAGEEVVAKFNGRHIILRTSWVFGGEQNFVVTMRRLAQDRDQLNVVSDQVGGPTAASHIAETLLTIAKAVVRPHFADWGIYHYCGSPAVSWYEFACEILKDEPSVGVSAIPSADYPTPAKRPRNSALDCAKIRSIFSITQPDWKNAVSLKKEKQ